MKSLEHLEAAVEKLIEAFKEEKAKGDILRERQQRVSAEVSRLITLLKSALPKE